MYTRSLLYTLILLLACTACRSTGGMRYRKWQKRCAHSHICCEVACPCCTPIERQVWYEGHPERKIDTSGKSMLHTRPWGGSISFTYNGDTLPKTSIISAHSIQTITDTMPLRKQK